MIKGRVRKKRLSTPFRLGPAGYLDLKGALDERRHFDLGDHDPAKLRKNLGINTLAEELFPGILTGVRFWPFLLVARDLEGRDGRKPSKDRIEKELSRIAKKQRKHQGVTPRTRIGPRGLATFRFYQGMLRAIDELSRKNRRAARLAEFMFDRRRRYRGDLAFFTKHEKRWKQLLVSSLGSSGRGFARFIDDTDLNRADDAIDAILKRSGKFHPKLAEAAAAYALLVCLYGIVEEGQVYHAGDSQKRAQLLMTLIRKRPGLPAARYHALIRQAASSPEPPLARVHNKARREGRRVLAGLRFGTFWNLYRRPSPRVLE